MQTETYTTSLQYLSVVWKVVKIKKKQKKNNAWYAVSKPLFYEALNVPGDL